jgi:hypothetical protein
MDETTLKMVLIGTAVAAFIVISLLLMTGAFNPVPPAQF